MTRFPDVNRLQLFAEHPGLQLLYLDFKSGVFIPQWMFTVAPDENCNLIAKIVSNFSDLFSLERDQLSSPNILKDIG